MTSAVRSLWPALLALAALPACSNTPPGNPGSCRLPTMSSCAADMGSGVPFDFTGTTAMESDDFVPSCPMGGGGGNDVAIEYTAPEAGRYDITTAGSSFDTVLTVLRGCAGAEVACNDDVRSGNTTSSVTVDLAACETIVIVVDGFSGGESGAFQLHVTTRESACADGNDNDGDGDADCADTDCFSPACSGTDDWPMAYQDFEWRVLELTNQRRAAGATCDRDVFGPAGPLEMDTVIRAAARGHSLDMGQQGYFEHDSLDGRTFADRMTDVGFMGASPWGENIAAGQGSPEEVVEGWMNSPGHCRNIMNPDYRTIGIGYANVDGSPYGHYWTQDFAAGH